MLPGLFAPGQVLRPLRGPAPGLPPRVTWFHVVTIGAAENVKFNKDLIPLFQI